MYTHVYRIDVLKKAKKYLKTDKYNGICPAIYSSLAHYNIRVDHIVEYYIPKFNINNAKKFGASAKYEPWWWKPYRFNIFSGRRRYLNWLIRQYKNDKTNLREL